MTSMPLSLNSGWQSQQGAKVLLVKAKRILGFVDAKVRYKALVLYCLCLTVAVERWRLRGPKAQRKT